MMADDLKVFVRDLLGYMAIHHLNSFVVEYDNGEKFLVELGDKSLDDENP